MGPLNLADYGLESPGSGIPAVPGSGSLRLSPRNEALATALRDIEEERRRAAQLERTVSRLQSLIMTSTPAAGAGGSGGGGSGTGGGREGGGGTRARRRASVCVTNDAGIASLQASYVSGGSSSSGAGGYNAAHFATADALDATPPRGTLDLTTDSGGYGRHGSTRLTVITSPVAGDAGDEALGSAEDAPLPSPIPSTTGTATLEAARRAVGAHRRSYVSQLFGAGANSGVSGEGGGGGGGAAGGTLHPGDAVATMMDAVRSARARRAAAVADAAADDAAENDVLAAVANAMSGREDLRHVLESVARANRAKAARHAEELAAWQEALATAHGDMAALRGQVDDATSAAVQLAQEVAAQRAAAGEADGRAAEASRRCLRWLPCGRRWRLARRGLQRRRRWRRSTRRGGRRRSPTCATRVAP